MISVETDTIASLIGQERKWKHITDLLLYPLAYCGERMQKPRSELTPFSSVRNEHCPDCVRAVRNKGRLL